MPVKNVKAAAQLGCMGSMPKTTPRSAASGAELLEGVADQVAGVVEGVARPGTAVDHQGLRVEIGGRFEGVHGVLDAGRKERPSLPVKPPAQRRWETFNPVSAKSSIPFSSPKSESFCRQTPMAGIPAAA